MNLCFEILSFVFRNWLEKAYKTLVDKERHLADLNKVSGKSDDILTHRADLKFLTISGQKFVSLSKEYVSSLNEFRMMLQQNNLKISKSIVIEEVSPYDSDYNYYYEEKSPYAFLPESTESASGFAERSFEALDGHTQKGGAYWPH